MSTSSNTTAVDIDPTKNFVDMRDKMVDYMLLHAGALIAAVVVMVVGLVLARMAGRLLERWLERKAMEPPMRLLLTRVTRLMIIAMALAIALGTAGVDVTVLVAGVSVAGVGVGLAFQGVLGNLVAGLTIIFTKPFRVGEYIELLGVQGQVKTIELFSTTLQHTDFSRVVVPNRKIVGEVLHNYGSVRQLELTVGVAYGTDLNAAMAIARGVLGQNARVLKEPVPFIGVTMLADSTINISIKPWTAVGDYNPARAELYQALAENFRANNIAIPFPQREVRLLGQG